MKRLFGVDTTGAIILVMMLMCQIAAHILTSYVMVPVRLCALLLVYYALPVVMMVLKRQTNVQDHEAARLISLTGPLLITLATANAASPDAV